MSSLPTSFKAQSAAQRMAELRKRRAAQGVAQLNIVADKLDHKAIKAFVVKLGNSRKKLKIK